MGTSDLGSWAPHSIQLLQSQPCLFLYRLFLWHGGQEELWVWVSFCPGVPGEVSCIFFFFFFLHVRGSGNMWWPTLPHNLSLTITRWATACSLCMRSEIKCQLRAQGRSQTLQCIKVTLTCGDFLKYRFPSPTTLGSNSESKNEAEESVFSSVPKGESKFGKLSIWLWFFEGSLTWGPVGC